MKILLVGSSDKNSPNGLKPSHVKQVKAVSDKISVKVVDEDDPKLQKEAENAEVIATGALQKIDFSKTNSLKLLHLPSAGVNRLPDFVLDSGIQVTNSSGVHPIPITEHIFAFMLTLARQMHLSHRTQIESKRWYRDRQINESILEITGKTICIVGLGAIGRETAKIAKAFGMKVIGVVRNSDRKEKNVDELVGIKDLAKSLKQSDFVVNILPGTKETKGLFDLNMFKKMKQTAYFINVGRGFTVVEKDLIEALKSGTIAGAGLDVFEEEPLSDKSPLWKMDNVILTPHYSGWTPHYTDRMIDIFITNLNAYLKNKPLPNLVDKKLGY